MTTSFEVPSHSESVFQAFWSWFQNEMTYDKITLPLFSGADHATFTLPFASTVVVTVPTYSGCEAAMKETTGE